jgi:MoaA/NifB/PqqE/SkfB family radical SAM enzyme
MALRSVVTNAWWLRQARRELPLITRSQPARADIEPTTFCNFRCPHCPTTEERPDGPGRIHLRVAPFTRLLDQLPAVYRIKLVGLGEPLMNPDFFEMVRVARRRHIRVLTTTNGSLLNAERRRELLACGISHVNVSIDAADPETHAQLRPGSDLGQISENLTALMKERGGRRWPQVRVWHVIQREATAQIPDLVDLCARWGVDGLLCTAKLTNFGSCSMEEIVGERRTMTEDLQRILPEARKRAAAANLEFRCPDGPPGPRVPKPEAACRWPWGRVFISARGEVRPCPYAAGPEGLVLGRLFNEEGHWTRFSEIWNGEAAQSLRAAVREAQNPAFCRACYLGWRAPEAPR